MAIKGTPSIEVFRTLPHWSAFASGSSAALVSGTAAIAPIDTFDMNNGGFASLPGSNVIQVGMGGMWLISWGINFGTAIVDGAQHIGRVALNPAAGAFTGTLVQQLVNYPGANASTAGGVLQIGSTAPPVFLSAGDKLRLDGRVSSVGASEVIQGNAAIGVSNTFIMGVYLGPTM